MAVSWVSHLPVLVIVIPLIFAFLSSLAGFWPSAVRRGIVGVGFLLHPLCVVLLVSRMLIRGPLLYEVGGWAVPLGIMLLVDELSVIFLCILALGMFFAFLYSFSTGTARQEKLHVFFFLLTASISGQMVAGDIFNLFVFLELTTVVSIALVALKKKRRPVISAFVYMVYAAISSTLLLIAIALLYNATGTLTMAHIAQRISYMPPASYAVVLVSVVISLGIKIGLVPLHFWQADAYDGAGSTVAGIFSGVVMKAGVYALLRLIFTVLGAGGAHSRLLFGFLLMAGCINIAAGHIGALFQLNLKKMLAFSSIAHAGYIFVGIGSGTAAGLAAAVFHAFNHFFLKTALFWSGRFFIAGKRSSFIPRMRGIAVSFPAMFIMFFLSALAIVGIPPTAGFASKWLIALALQERGLLLPLVFIAAGTVVSLWYYARIFVLAVQHPHETGNGIQGARMTKRQAAGALLVLMVLCLYSLSAAFFPQDFYSVFEAAAFRLREPAEYMEILLAGALQ